MKLSLFKGKVGKYSSLYATFLLVGCMSSPSPLLTQTPLTLQESTIDAHKGDIKGLYNAWISPHLITDSAGGYIPHSSSLQRAYSMDAVRDGFNQFCIKSGGTNSQTKDKYGETYSCVKKDASLIGNLTASRVDSAGLEVSYELPKEIEHRISMENIFATRKAHNGPSGVVITNEGKFKFLRIGNLKERDVVELMVDTKARKYIPIEAVKKIEFEGACCNLNATFRDGSKKNINSSDILERNGLNYTSNYGGGKSGFPMVIVDPQTGQPYTRIFENLSGIKTILFDDVSAWNKQAEVIETKFDYSSALKSRLAIYKKSLQAKASIMNAEAISKGWMKLLPDGKITPKLSTYLRDELSRLSARSACYENDVTTGIISFDMALKCDVALRESRLLEDGYSLSADMTPLSSIIIFEKIKQDLR